VGLDEGALMMKYVILFILAFIAGFLTMWLFDDLGSDVVIFTSEEELQELCWNGLRKGEP
jgi:hypothetical protein